jgi:hypothetical protein
MSPKLAAIILASAVALFAAVIFDFLVSRLAMANFGRMPIWVVLLSAAFLAEFAVVVVLSSRSCFGRVIRFSSSTKNRI